MPKRSPRLPVFVCRVENGFVTQHVEPNAKGPEPLQLADAMARKRRLNCGHAGPPYRVIDSAGVTITDSPQPAPRPAAPVAPATAPKTTRPRNPSRFRTAILGPLTAILGAGPLAAIMDQATRPDTAPHLPPDPTVR